MSCVARLLSPSQYRSKAGGGYHVTFAISTKLIAYGIS